MAWIAIECLAAVPCLAAGACFAPGACLAAGVCFATVACFAAFAGLADLADLADRGAFAGPARCLAFAGRAFAAAFGRCSERARCDGAGFGDDRERERVWSCDEVALGAASSR
ncbi:MAG TPA: hypothetical protein VNA89_04805 [Gemmatimonadaceae bacterium]|nr:hypothetical protein [Gemmatimonadaceae bacterium]